jgi:polysaccharide export outer membrane protein
MRLLPLLLLLGACASAHRPPNVADTDVPLRLPAAEAFTFGPGDALRITVWRHDDLSMDVTVAPDGAISYPLVGRIVVAGLTYDQLVQKLQGSVSEYYVDAQVAVNITSITSQKVMVMGEVQSPAVLQITNDLSLLEALTRTGGINENARTDNILLIRGGLDAPQLYAVDVRSIYGRGDFSQMIYLQKGDIVYVPTTTIANVERFFRRLQTVLAPAVGGSAIYRNVVSGTTLGAAVTPAD